MIRILFHLYLLYIILIIHLSAATIDVEALLTNQSVTAVYGIDKKGHVHNHPEEKKDTLSCYGFDHRGCNNTEGCETIVTCISRPESRAFCFNVIPLRDGTMNESTAIKGCLNQDESGLRICDSNRCIASVKGKRETLYCCCNTDFCNGVMENVENATASDQFFPNIGEDEFLTPISYSHAVAFIVAGAVIVVLLMLICWMYYKMRIRARRKTNGSLKAAGCGDDAEQLLILGNSQESLNITHLEKIGNGRFGEVYRGQIGDAFVAVKIFPKSELNSWKAEKAIFCLNGLQENKHILRFVGSEIHDNSYWIVTEYHRTGSLFDFLKENVLNTSDAVKLITSLLDGLSFLHKDIVLESGLKKPCIVHRQAIFFLLDDFKSHNILLKNDLTAVIADFGLALICEDGESPAEGTRFQVGTKRYMAPEVLEGATETTAFAFRQIDVYAASLVLWEIITRTVFHNDDEPGSYCQPYQDELKGDPSINELRTAVVRDKKRPLIRSTIFRTKFGCGLWKMIEEMWVAEPDGRITAGCALVRVKQLSKLIDHQSEKTNDPTNEEVELSSMYIPRGEKPTTPKNKMNGITFHEMYVPGNQHMERMPNIMDNIYPIIKSTYNQNNLIHPIGTAKV